MNCHTEGPWSVDIICDVGTDENRVLAVVTPAVTIAEIPLLGNGGADEETRAANARLIAASPDLLAVVADVVKFASSKLRAGFGPVDYGNFPLLLAEAARAAIAKATQ